MADNHSDQGSPLRVAVIDDDQNIRNFLNKAVEKAPDMEICGSWKSGEEALATIALKKPEVVMVDLELPGISGEDCIRALSGMLPCSACVVLTVHEQPARVFRALQAGADGYLLKGVGASQIVSGIREAHHGGVPLSPDIARLVIGSFRGTSRRKDPMPLPGLSPREHEVLEKLSLGMVPKEAAAEMGLSYETVRGYLKCIYRKLHVRSRTEAVLRFLEGPPPSPPVEE